ncbi:MAG: trypsin-like peptidase domain-containing protein [Actinomycetota bacterium]|nr:trypsin-like peptidase domain-containing protein [Actinomycetota bacterium]
MQRVVTFAVLAVLALPTACSSAGEEPWFPQTPAAPVQPTTSPLPPVPFDPGRDRLVQVVERVRRAVVNVRANPDLPGGGSEGTGFVVRSDGVVVTNFHVVEGATEVQVITGDGRRLQARVIGADENGDLTVLKMDAQGLPTIPLGDSDALQLGQTVVAVGFALGLQGGPSVTSGIVSGLGRTIDAGGPGTASRTYEDVIQTDAAINPGNSGGPLVDLRGRVVGINTAGVQAAAAENIGFAIAINRVRPLIEHAIENPTDLPPVLGVSTRPVDPLLATTEGLAVDSGLLVLGVLQGGPAQRAGIRAGDVIVGLAGRSVTDNEELQAELLEHDPGDRVEVGLVRGTEDLAVEVTLGVRPVPIGA